MAKILACITYDVVTEESAQDGDTSDNGFWLPGGWKHSLGIEGNLEDARNGGFDFEFKDAMREARDHGCHEDGGSAFYSVDPDIDYGTGEETRYAFHPPDKVTRASYQRIKRWLNGANVLTGVPKKRHQR